MIIKEFYKTIKLSPFYVPKQTSLRQKIANVALNDVVSLGSLGLRRKW